MDSVQDTLAGGLPHSEIHGSKSVRNSPWLIAAYDVLHRLSAPRHPPNALTTLDRSHCRYPPARQRTDRLKRPAFFEVMPDRRRLNTANLATCRFSRAAFEQTFSSRYRITRAHTAGAAMARIAVSTDGRLNTRTKPVGGARRDRTDDLLLAKQALSQLSYGPGSGHSSRTPEKKWWARVDLNYRPHAYQACALTT